MTSRDTLTPAAAVGQPLGAVRSDLTHQVRAAWVVTRRELLRFRQDRMRMLTMLLQPLLFIFVMGTGLGSIVDTGGGLSFRTFLFPGVLATSVLFTAAFAGISLVWDREFGFLREMMVAPVSRASIIWGKCLGGAVVATGQSLVLLALVGTVGIPLPHLGAARLARRPHAAQPADLRRPADAAPGPLPPGPLGGRAAAAAPGAHLGGLAGPGRAAAADGRRPHPGHDHAGGADLPDHRVTVPGRMRHPRTMSRVISIWPWCWASSS